MPDQVHKNPRRAVLAQLKAIKSWANEMVVVWNQRMTVQVSNSVDDVRLLTTGERYENSADRWQQLVEYMDIIMEKAKDVRQFALDRKAEVEEGKRW